MKKLITAGLALALLSPYAHASVVAVVDSGTDFTHDKLKGAAWENAGEIAGDKLDNERNGKVDDVNGWNFVDSYGRVFFREHLREINPIVYDLMRVIAHRQAGTVTPGETQFFDENFGKLPDGEKQGLAAHLNYFGIYAHGTHVAGIVNNLNANAKIMSARVFPDEAAPRYDGKPKTPREGLATMLAGPIDWIYRLLGLVSNGQFTLVGQYLNEQKVDVANYSLGLSIPTIAKVSLQLRGTKEPTADEIAAEARRIYAQFEPEGRKWMEASPETLFVIAAGNDGTDNDKTPAFPANVRVGNSISVAASQAYAKLAAFSNYGATTVDVAAPGVAILSSVPAEDHSATLPLSGTSMAAPFVTGVASRVKDANPKLKPNELREILMGTVDQKDWLQGKVISSGVVNNDRAARAGELSVSMSVKDAIAQARSEVADKADTDFGPGLLPSHDEAPASPALDALASTLVF